VVDIFKKYYENNLEKMTSTKDVERASQYYEVISLFFYHLFHKFVLKAARSRPQSGDTRNLPGPSVG
jgi:hypothetical protein